MDKLQLLTASSFVSVEIKLLNWFFLEIHLKKNCINITKYYSMIIVTLQCLLCHIDLFIWIVALEVTNYFKSWFFGFDCHTLLIEKSKHLFGLEI